MHCRLTPSYALIIGLDAALFQYLTDGPLWRQEGVEPDRCSSWWTNLLYVNNFVHTDKMVRPLAVDLNEAVSLKTEPWQRFLNPRQFDACKEMVLTAST